MGITLSPWMMAFLILMTGFAGFVDSAAGGGGLISLPAYLFAGLPPHYTYATNKFSAACGTTFATASFFKSGAMNVKVGVLAAIGSFAGSALGAHIVLLLSDEMLRTMMFIILPVAAVIILWQRNLPDENRDDGTLDLKKILLALAIGLGIGLYDGIMGPGTGTFAIIAFTTLMGFDLRTANGNGKVLNLASNYASLFTYLMNGLVVFHIGIPCAVSNILGNLLGSHFALKKGARFIRPMMLVVLVLLLGKLISDAPTPARKRTTWQTPPFCPSIRLCVTEHKAAGRRTIWNGLRFALAIISGKNILFVVPKRLRAFRNYFFTGKNKDGQPAGCPSCSCFI